MSLTVGISVVTLGRGVSSVSNSNPDHSLWISYLLQSYKEGIKEGYVKQYTSVLGFLAAAPLYLESSSPKAQKPNSN